MGIFALLCVLSSSAHAVDRSWSGVPSSWRMQSYQSFATPTTILWFTASASYGCASGLLQLPPSAPESEHRRLWNLVTAAKLTATKIFVFYDDATCTLSSYGVESP